MDNSSERRQVKRSEFQVTAYVELPGQEPGLQVQLSDFSFKGARIEHEGKWKPEPGQQCQLRINLGPVVAIEMQALVARVDEQYIGLQAVGTAQLRNLT